MKTSGPTHLNVRDVFRINGTKSKELNDMGGKQRRATPLHF